MKKIVAAVALAFTAAGAQAATMSYSVAPASTGMVATDWLTTLSVAKYNLANTLTRVVLSLVNNTDATFVLTNNNTNPVTFNTTPPGPPDFGPGNKANVQTSIYVYDAVIGALVTTSGTFGTPGFNGMTLAGTAGPGSNVYNSGVQTGTASNSATWTTAPVLSFFTGAVGGTDTASMAAYAQGISDWSGPSNVVFAPVSAAQAVLNVTYYYTVPDLVPEPGSLALLGLGFLGLIAARRRLG